MGGQRYGIQGGNGSFNDQALQDYFRRKGIAPGAATVEFLYTTENVLAALQSGAVDYGQFAVANTINGPVTRSVAAMQAANFTENFREVARYTLPISHCLMAHPDSAMGDIDTIVSHPTVFIQCAHNLQTRYPRLRCVPGAGSMEDPAFVGQAIMAGTLTPNHATLSSERIAQLFGLQVLGRDLQDQNPNETTFVLAAYRGG